MAGKDFMARCRANAVMFESLRLKPYRCPAGRLTIGVGRNLQDVGISVEEAYALLDNDLRAAICDLKKTIFKTEWRRLPEAIREVLVDMRFNLGPVRFRGFENMIAAVRVRDWDSMTREMRDSRWFRQVGQRAFYLIGMVCDVIEDEEAQSSKVKGESGKVKGESLKLKGERGKLKGERGKGKAAGTVAGPTSEAGR